MEIVFKVIAKFCFFALIFSYFFMRFRLNKLRHKDYGREFSDAEYNKLSGIASSIAAKGQFEKYPILCYILQYAALPLLIVFIGATGYAVAQIYIYFRSEFILQFAPGIHDLHAGIEFPASSIIGGVTGMFLWGVVYIIIGRYSETLRTFFVHKGWGTLTGQPREWDDYIDEVAHLVYIKNLTLENVAASNHTVINHIFERSSRKWMFCTSFMCVITAFFVYLDIHHYSWIDTQNNRVVQNRYFSLTETSYGPEDVKGVIKKCDLVSYDSGPSAHLEYVIIGPGGGKLNLGHEPWELLPFIKTIEAAQATKPETIFNLPIALNELPKTKETCLAYLKHGYETDTTLKAELWALYDF